MRKTSAHFIPNLMLLFGKGDVRDQADTEGSWLIIRGGCVRRAFSSCTGFRLRPKMQSAKLPLMNNDDPNHITRCILVIPCKPPLDLLYT
jgi:hypothetical protein